MSTMDALVLQDIINMSLWVITFKVTKNIFPLGEGRGSGQETVL